MNERRVASLDGLMYLPGIGDSSLSPVRRASLQPIAVSVTLKMSEPSEVRHDQRFRGSSTRVVLPDRAICLPQVQC